MHELLQLAADFWCRGSGVQRMHLANPHGPDQLRAGSSSLLPKPWQRWLKLPQAPGSLGREYVCHGPCEPEAPLPLGATAAWHAVGMTATVVRPSRDTPSGAVARAAAVEETGSGEA